MKNIIILIIMLLCSSGNADKENTSKNTETFLYIYKKAITYPYINQKLASRYAYVIMRHSEKYNLDPKMIARQIEQETHFRYWRISNKQAYGAMQVTPYFYEYLIWHIPVDRGRLAKHIDKKKIKNFRKYFLRIDYNIEMGCYVMRGHINKYTNISLALVAYNHGEGTDYFENCLSNGVPKNNKYVNKIIGNSIDKMRIIN